MIEDPDGNDTDLFSANLAIDSIRRNTVWSKTTLGIASIALPGTWLIHLGSTRRPVGMVLIRLSQETLESARANERRRARVVAVWPGRPTTPMYILLFDATCWSRRVRRARERGNGWERPRRRVATPLHRRAQSTLPGCRAARESCSYSRNSAYSRKSLTYRFDIRIIDALRELEL